jgi:hypothetical protein
VPVLRAVAEVSAEVVPIDNTLEVALAYAEAGFLVFPLRWPTKEPATTHGFHDATTDADTIRGWWQARRNIGLATGPQPNGWNLLAVDVDTDKGGKVSFLDLVDRHDGRDLLKSAPQHMTPRGGWHLFFDAPEDYRNTREAMGAGIDTRGAGGYVVAPPSRWANEDGELKPYTAKPGLGLLERPPIALPWWILEALQEANRPAPPPERRSPGLGGPSAGDDTSPYAWARENVTWEDTLLRNGWALLRRENNGDSRWRRPGKTDRGHSAVLHTSGAFVIFTTEIPRGLESLGTPTRDRTGVTISIGDFICAYEHGGDRSAFARHVRSLMPRVEARTAPLSVNPVTEGPGATPGEALRDEPATPASFLPEEFWAARPVFGQIRTAARARLVGPDALFMNVLVRWATLIPPTYRLPAVVGSAGTFDLVTCVVAETGVGKTAAQNASADVVQTRLADDGMISFDIPLGSGEGIPQWFMVDEVGDDGKRTGKQVVGKTACHFVVDEATAFVATGQRKGATVAQTLTSAWSGSTLGQANADASTRRIVAGGRVRVCAAMSMQATNAHMLFSDELRALGFAGRLLFARAEDPGATLEPITEERVQAFPNLALFGPEHTVLEYDPAIVTEIREARLGSLRMESDVDKTASQHLLLRCKIAGVLALHDGRRCVSIDDWGLAGTVLRTSVAVQETLAELHRHHVSESRVTSATARGEAESIVEDVKERAAISRLGDAIVKRVLGSPDARLARSDVRRAACSSATRHRFEAAVEWAVAAGRLADDGTHLSKP